MNNASMNWNKNILGIYDQYDEDSTTKPNSNQPIFDSSTIHNIRRSNQILLIVNEISVFLAIRREKNNNKSILYDFVIEIFDKIWFFFAENKTRAKINWI